MSPCVLEFQYRLKNIFVNQNGVTYKYYMAKRSKQDKPCPNHRDCRFPTMNRQRPLDTRSIRQIGRVAPEIVPALAEASICSSCGCVYTGKRKTMEIIGFHDDPNMEADTPEAIWYSA